MTNYLPLFPCNVHSCDYILITYNTGLTMTYEQATEHEPTKAEALNELARHGSTWEEFSEYCITYPLRWNAPDVLLGFLGY